MSKAVTIKQSRSANECARAIVKLVELETDCELSLEVAMKITAFVQIAIDAECGK